MNKITLFGHIGVNPELRRTASGRGVTNIRLATNEFYGQGDDRSQHTEWHNLVLWGTQAETMAKYGQKGTPVLLEGHVRTRQVERTVGTEKITYDRTEVIVDRFQFVGPKRKETPKSDEIPPFATEESETSSEAEMVL